VVTVKFITSEGTNASMPDQKASTPTALRANGFFGATSRIFIGWATANGGEVVYADKATYPFDKDATLYAVWRSAGEALNIVAALTGATSASVSFQSAPNRDGTPAVRSSYDVTLIRGGGGAEEVRNVPGPGTYLFNLAPGNSYYFRVDFWASNVIVTPAASANLRSVQFVSALSQGTMLTMWASEPTALPLNVYSLSGYQFAGWAQVTDGQMPQPGTLAYADGATYPFTNSIMLYARWIDSLAKTVTFHANGGGGSITSQSASTATALTLNAGAITRSGYTFGGWNTSANGNGTAYADGTSYPFADSTTLYAQWVAVAPVLTVTFDANDGVGSMASQSASKSTALTSNANAIKRSGYAFNGWNTSKDGSGTAYADGGSYLFAASETLYATWGCLPLTVTVSAKRVGANKAEVYFTAPSSESPWTSFAANAAKEGGKGAKLPTALNTGTITVNGLDKKSGYTFDVTATNEAGCAYKATANRITKW
jgi:hypothetical protein